MSGKMVVSATVPPWSTTATSLATSQQLRPCRQVWYDSLTRKKFSSEAKYREATGSKKYQELVRRSGGPAPEPIVTLRKAPAAGASRAQTRTTVVQQQSSMVAIMSTTRRAGAAASRLSNVATLFCFVMHVSARCLCRGSERRTQLLAWKTMRAGEE